ncbi:hypothetical protein D3C75_354660 [compost metagenome]
MDIAFLVKVRIDTQFFRARTHHGQRSLNGLLHHFTQRAGIREFAFTRYAGGFNSQQIAAHFRPRQPRHLTDAVFIVRATIVIALNAEIFVQVVAVNFNVLQGLIQQQLLHRFTAQLGDFALQATHARFTSVVTNNADNRTILYRNFVLFQRVTLNLLRKQVALGDVQLFVFGVARKTDHFHTIQQWSRNVHGVRGRHEHDIAKIVVHFQIVIAERHVLFRIQHFKQGRRRVAAHIGRHFVDLIQQEQWVFNAYFRHFLDQLARHRADIGPAVTADFGFVTNAAQRHTDVFTSGRFGNGLPQRGFTHPRRSYQAQDRALELVYTALNRKVLKDAIFNTFQTVMVGIEDLLCLTQIFFDLATGVPRNLYHPLNVATHDGRFGRHRRHHFQLLQFCFGFLFCLFRHFCRVDLTLQRFVFVWRIVHLAELFLNSLHLLVQIVLALRFFHLLLHAVANAFLNLQQIDFRFHHRHQIFQTFVHVGHLQHGLFVRQLERHVRSDGVCQTRRIVDAVQRRQHFRWDFFVQLDIAFELANRSANQHFLLTLIKLRRFKVFRFCREVFAIIRQRGNTRTLQPLDQHLNGAVRQLQHL